MLWEKEIDAFRKCRWEVDCPRLWLTHGSTDQPIDIAGPGTVRQEPDGTVSFKLFASSSAAPQILKLGASPDVQAGTVLADEHFVNLHLIDAKGRSWSSRRILVSPDVSYCTPEPSCVVSGAVDELRSGSGSFDQPSSGELQFWLRTRSDLAYNCGTETVTSVAGTKRNTATSRNVAKFSAGGVAFELQRQKKDIVVHARFEAARPDDVVARFVDSLQFVTAKPAAWYLLRIACGKEESIRIRSRAAKAKRTRLHPPIDKNRPNDVWRLFDAYFQFLLRDDSKSCSRHLAAVRESSANSMDVMLREIAIAIEGLSADLFGNIAKPTDPFLDAVRSVEQYLARWPGTNDTIAESEIRSRLPGLIGQLKQGGATARLRELVARKVIDKRHYDAWKANRPRFAHGAYSDAIDFQQHIDNWGALTVLFYHLIFHAIGYAGSFADYATPGWPVVAYPECLTQQQ